MGWREARGPTGRLRRGSSGTPEERIAPAPRATGSALVGEHAWYWRWRTGDDRDVARIEEERLMVLVVRVAHRREVNR